MQNCDIVKQPGRVRAVFFCGNASAPKLALERTFDPASCVRIVP
jgi:hypothetical protein